MPLSIIRNQRFKIYWSLIVLLTVTTLLHKSLPTLLLSLRTLSLNLGNGKCKWTPPKYTADKSKQYFRSLIAGFPGGSKRIIFTQLEALAGISANDEWPISKEKQNLPFMKSNYPHHEGVWSWEKTMDQVILVIRNPRHALVEYHNVLHDIDYANNAEDAYALKDNLYRQRAPVNKFIEWRDNRTEYEINWWGWFIDYWMEGGIMRDIQSHELTTFEHFKRQMQPGPYTESGKAFQDFVGNVTVQPELDDHCIVDMPNGACEPIAVVSIDRLMDPVKGYAEQAKLAAAVEGKQGIDVIAEEARDCIWEEVVIRRKGVRTMRDRTGPKEESYSFTPLMYGKMIAELTRLKSKYTAPEWDDVQPAQDLLILLDDFILDITKDLING